MLGPRPLRFISLCIIVSHVSMCCHAQPGIRIPYMSVFLSVTLCYLPRDAMLKRGLCCCPVSDCPSVCHVGALYPGIWRYRQTSFSAWQPHHSGFRPPVPVPNSKGNPFSGDTKKYKGLENFAIFDWNHHLSPKWYEIGPLLLWNVNRKSYALYRMVIFPMTLTGPIRFSRSRHFVKSNISKMVRFRHKVTIEH